MFAFVCSVLLLVISSSNSQENSTNIDDYLTMRYEIYTDSTTYYNNETITLRHDLHKKFMNNTQNDKEFYTNDNREDNDLIQHKRYKHSMQNKDDEQNSMKSNTNSNNVNHKRNFMPQEVHENVIEKNDSMSLEVFKNSSKDANETNIVPNEMCHNDTCIRLCCFLGARLVGKNCIPEKIEYIFPNVYTNDSTQSEKKVNEWFQLSIYDSCQEDHVLLSEGVQDDYKIFINGSIYLTYSKIFVESTSYCLAVVDGSEFKVSICSKTYDKIKDIIDKKSLISDNEIINISADIVSILLLGSVFLVYSILPELRNVHGFMLRNYSGALFVAHGISIVYILIKSDDVQYPVCVTMAFLTYFCYMAGSFWLNIISFDMWCTFRGFCSLQRNVRQREKRKLIYYTIFAWGCPFMFAVFCVSMDFLSEYVPSILRPEFHLGDCWFSENNSYLLYYYGLDSICILSSICLSISTALKIERYKKDTGHRLKDSESKCYNDNKKWFNLYLKLFIMLFILIGIKWLMITAYALSENVSFYNSYVINFLDIMQHPCTFIIFVWKKRIKRMLFKRFGCNLLPKA
ncbi:G-protein coupled receptor Mth2-like [Nylanderia fulva]|uniref:G-protein coupled receptor Mth2-like n=1 Tax=Nylanderia fulva TaxID=613905 RepID=UPI0010FB945F|nr:G-protein coupled receptor Mth2-like [Nylanderia fulva]